MMQIETPVPISNGATSILATWIPRAHASLRHDRHKKLSCEQYCIFISHLKVKRATTYDVN